MNKDKQIEEMASIIGDCKSTPDEICDKHLKCADCKASRCYNAGYRKASEVAREIFAEIENKLQANMSGEFRGDSVEWFDYFELHLAEDIAELKKKYTESEDTK